MCQDPKPLTNINSDSVTLESTNQMTVAEVADSTQKTTFLSHFSLVLDYGKIIAMATDFESKKEFGIELGLMNKFLFIGEYGQGKLTPNNAYVNTNYKSNGNYYRFGFGYNGTISAKTNMGLSIKYAISNFSDGGTIKIESTSGLFNSTSDSFARNNLSAEWFELVLHSESIIRTNLYAGFKFSVRRMLKYDVQTPIDVYTIPGYGRTFDKSTPAINLYLKYRINFK